MTLEDEIRSFHNPEKAAFLPHFFKTGRATSSYALFPETLTILVEHVTAIVQADDFGPVHACVLRNCEDAGPDRNVQLLAGEVVRDIG